MRARPEVAPTLCASCKSIYVFSLKFGSYQDQLFHNFKISVRGSIRKPPNAATWVLMPIKPWRSCLGVAILGDPWCF
jgi:hypothetical protein